MSTEFKKSRENYVDIVFSIYSFVLIAISMILMARLLPYAIISLILSIVLLAGGFYLFNQNNPLYIYYFYGLLINSIMFVIGDAFIDIFLSLLLIPIGLYIYVITNGFFADIRYQSRMETRRISTGQRYDPYQTQKKIEQGKKREFFEEKYKGKIHLSCSAILTILLITFNILSFQG
ncbi:MAG: hypothetical protein ACXABO_18705 [Promethearchaeota archaeon]|jgi:Zn-dependent protease with chaperone function